MSQIGTTTVSLGMLPINTLYRVKHFTSKSHHLPTMDDQIPLLQSMYPRELSFLTATLLEFNFPHGRLQLDIDTGAWNATDNTRGQAQTSEDIIEIIMDAEKRFSREPITTQSEKDPVSTCNVSAYCIIWMHHILALSKRKNIMLWAKELKLRGRSKPGYPGILIAEGRSEHLTEYIQRLKVSTLFYPLSLGQSPDTHRFSA